jgi:hypothetical protein
VSGRRRKYSLKVSKCGKPWQTHPQVITISYGWYHPQPSKQPPLRLLHRDPANFRRKSKDAAKDMKRMEEKKKHGNLPVKQHKGIYILYIYMHLVDCHLWEGSDCTFLRVSLGLVSVRDQWLGIWVKDGARHGTSETTIISAALRVSMVNIQF